MRDGQATAWIHIRLPLDFAEKRNRPRGVVEDAKGKGGSPAVRVIVSRR